MQDQAFRQSVRASVFFRSACALAVAGLVLSAYLGVSSRTGGPAGCGAGSGCEQVLSSRWAGIGPVPIGFAAAAVYVALLFALVTLHRRGPGQFTWIAVGAMSGAILGAAAWFVAIQLAVLGTVCVYCMVDHALGVLAATCAIALLLRARSAASIAGWVASGISLALAALAALQLALPYSVAPVRLVAGSGFDSATGPERNIGLLSGALKLNVREEPLLGSADARHVVAALLDHNCAHCRRTHEYLSTAVKQWPADLAVIELPCPLNSGCNKHIAETERRFESSCELAVLALALWKQKPDQFAGFSEWLFEPETPRTPGEAAQEAEERAGAVLQPGVREWAASIINRNTEAFGRSGTDRLPIVLSPEIGGIAGRPADEKELFDILETELKLPPRGK